MVSRLALSLSDSGQDQVLGLLYAFASAQNLNGLILGLVSRHLNLAVALAADRLDLASVGSDDETDEVSRSVVGLGLRLVLQNQLLGLGDVLGRSAKDPWDLALFARLEADDLPRVNVGCGVCIVRDQWQGALDGPGRRRGLGRDALTGVVYRHLVVVAKLPEDLTAVGHDVVQIARDLKSLAVLLLDQAGDVLLSLGNVFGPSRYLDASLAVALAGDVDGDAKLRLELAFGIASASDERSVLVDWHVNHLSHLALPLGNNLLDLLDDVVHDFRPALDLDGVTIRLLLGELDRAGKSASIIRAAGSVKSWGGQVLLTACSNKGLVMFLVNLNRLDDGVVKLGSLLLENLLGLLHLGRSSLDGDLNDGSISVCRNIDSGPGQLSKLVQSGAALANQRADLLLLHSDGGSILVQRVDLVAGLIGALLGSSNNDLVRSLLAARLASLACGFAGLIVSILGRLREEDENFVPGLQAIDLAALSTNQLSVVLGINLENVRGLVSQSPTEILDVRSGLLGLGLGSLELHLAILDLDLDVESITELLDVAATLADEVVGKLLREVKGQGVSTFLLVNLLLLDKGRGLAGDRLGSSQGHDIAGLGHANGDLRLIAALLLLLDESAELLVEFGRDIQRDGDNRLLLVDETQYVLLGSLQSLPEVLQFRFRRLDAGRLVGTFSRIGALKDQKHGNVGFRRVWDNNMDTELLLDLGSDLIAQVLVEEGVDSNRLHTRRWVSVENCSDLRLRTNGILTLTGVQLPRKGAVLRDGSVDVRIVLLLQALNLLALAKVSGDVGSMGHRSSRSVAVRPRNVNVGHLHTHGEIHGSIDAGLHLGGGTNDGDHIVVFLLGEHNGTAGLPEEVFQGNTSLPNDELVSASLDGELFSLQLPLQLGDTTRNQLADPLHGLAVTGKLNMLLVFTGRSKYGWLTGGRCDGERRGRVQLISGDADLDSIGLLDLMRPGVSRAGNEGVESRRDSLHPGLDVSRSLVDDLLNFPLGSSGRNSIALDSDEDNGLVILLVNRLVRIGLGHLDLGTRPLLDRLDSSATLADDEGAGGLGNGDLNHSLQSTSVKGDAAEKRRHCTHTLEPI
ncbi:hypothetical protein CCMA1212_007922 [Trichoderma ghanense]|uniref:Uncharacterized protein n=1 Tax=Trichoderma ghanense TaxID=65468 RepID=A0ABY2GYI1_9HYPO